MLSEEAYRALQADFQDNGNDGLDNIEACIDGVLRKGQPQGEAMRTIRREVHTLKGMGGSFGYPLITAITHRLEDYMSEETEITSELSQAINTFLDPVRTILADAAEPQGEEAAALLRRLPSRQPPADVTVKQVDVEVLIGIPASVTARIVRTVLYNCGFRAVRATNFMDCFMTAVRARPDAIVVSQTLDELSGVEMAMSLRALNVHQNTPIAILTSFNPSDAVFKVLPDDIAVIRSGKANFDNDMADFLTRVDIKDR